MIRRGTRSYARAAAGLAAIAALALALASPALGFGGRTSSGRSDCDRKDGKSVAHHVLLISVDGMHESDLDRYVAAHPTSALAKLVKGGAEFTNASTPVPSDSFPGLIAQVTGGNPKTTGIYYDVSYNTKLYAPGTTLPTISPAGTVVTYDESIDKDPSSIDAGQGLSGLPGSILGMTGNPTTLIDPTQLPVSPLTGKPVYPHQYLKVNTVFEVLRSHHLRTAWSDKHPAYEILNGPSGKGVEDLFTPEINSSADASGNDWTKVNAYTQTCDGYKVQAVLNEIDGYDHSRTKHVGVPAILGMNFQSVSTAEKLPTSGGQPGGYLADGVTPGPVLTSALDFVNAKMQLLLDELSARGLSKSTVIILSAKHGQSPQQGSSLTRIDDAKVVADLNAAWNAAGHSGELVANSMDDDALILWLNDRSATATSFAKSFLLGYNGNGTAADGKAKATDINKAAKAYTAAGLQVVYAGSDAASYFGVKPGNSRVPDIWGVVKHGTVYTGGTKKIAEHGGADSQDCSVPLVVYGAGVKHVVSSAQVETTRIAPTILRALGISPCELEAVRAEHTKALPVF